MPNEKKIQTVTDLAEKIKKSTALYLTDYQGLKVSQLQEIRAQLKTVGDGGQLAIVKNTLLKLALKMANFPAPEMAKIAGPTALLTCLGDELKPLNFLAKYIDDRQEPRLKAGYYKDRWLDGPEVQRLAQLPPLETLRAQLVWSLNAPVVGLAQVCRNQLQGLVVVLKEIEKKKH